MEYSIQKKLLSLVLILPILFVLNVYLIYLSGRFIIIHGVVYGEGLLYYTRNINWSASIIFFIIFYITTLIIMRAVSNLIIETEANQRPENLGEVSNTYLIAAIALLGIITEIPFFFIPELNPDFARYFDHGKILAERGIVYYLLGWGTKFFTHVDMPFGSFHIGLLFKLFGVNRLAVQVTHTLFYVLMCVLIYFISKILFNQKVGVLSSLVFISLPFLKTQVPLLLVDTTSALYITLFMFFILLYLYSKFSKICSLILSAIFLFFSVYSKILAPFYVVSILLSLFLISVFDEKNEMFKRFIVFISISAILVLSYMAILEPWLKSYVIRHIPSVWRSVLDFKIAFVTTILIITATILVGFTIRKVKGRFLKYLKSNKNYIMLIYLIAIIAFMVFDPRSSRYYLSTLPIAIGLLPAVISVFSIFVAIYRGDKNVLIPGFWFLIPLILVPHIFRYLIPAYPAVAILIGYVLANIKLPNLRRLLLVFILVSNLVIAYTVMYPMCITAQYNVMELSKDLRNLRVTNLTVIYEPHNPFWKNKFNLNVFKAQFPIWIEYYSGTKIKVRIIMSTRSNTAEGFVAYITDHREFSLENLRNLLNEYNVKMLSVYNFATHEPYWRNTGCIVLMRLTKTIRLTELTYYTNLPHSHCRIAKLNINGITKTSIYEHPTNKRAVIIFKDIFIRPNAKLKFSIALDPAVWSPKKGDGVTFEIFVRYNKTETKIFSKYIDPKHNPKERKWNNFEVDLSKYADKRVDIILSTLPGPKNDNRWDWAWWGDPKIVW